ncbi:hypothetical protein E4T66_06480 [Sinimarinibacterium sp. CAU 1509]|uniref:hypothetical protein n=1 Tax=Sinimarinibacterium sp. CAU 1509 TaxID=2562283 RepID=UPI0010ACF810|nr:hypothetical protein [Sinimarinibacterium sp. CAU 1509]TJY61892.1 hypothetical protein E4T66_06480 [Sinimarinibacterium sp. CAU 1509]
MPRAVMGRGLAGLGLLLLSLLQSGCLAAFRPVPEQIPTQAIDGAGAHHRQVVVLPGRADDLEGLRRSGIVEAIQQGDPQADVLLVGATPGYYREGRLVERLHDQIVAPARARGYRWIALVGASMGGFGALMYQRVHPGEIDALLLLAPYMGDERLQRDIVDAGGVGGWNPGPLPPPG